MPSARIERAVLPVHKNRTLQTRSAMSALLGWATRGQVSEEWRTDRRPALAAVLDQEGHDRAEAVETGPIDDQAAAPLGADEAGARQDPKMCGHGIVRHRQPTGDLAGWEAVRLMAHQEPEHVEARRLGEGRQGDDR